MPDELRDQPITTAAASALERLTGRIDELQAKLEARAAQPDTEAIIAAGVARAEAIIKPIAERLGVDRARSQADPATEATKDMRFGEAVRHLLHN